jgi:hypothetical protein
MDETSPVRLLGRRPAARPHRPTDRRPHPLAVAHRRAETLGDGVALELDGAIAGERLDISDVPVLWRAVDGIRHLRDLVLPRERWVGPAPPGCV